MHASKALAPTFGVSPAFLIAYRRLPEILILLAIGQVLVRMGAHHAPFSDEAQAWLLARDSALLELFTERLRYEGSPGLGHLVLWCAQAVGLPYDTLWLLGVGPALGAIALILFAAPFPRLLRVGFACSYFVAYQYAVIARSYSWSLLLICILAATFKRRWERPIGHGILLALLSQTNVHSLIIAGALGVDWLLAAWRERRPVDRSLIAGLVLPMVAGVLAVAQMWPKADQNFWQWATHGPWVLMVLGDVAWDDTLLAGAARLQGASATILASVLSIMLLAPSLYTLVRQRDVIFALGFAGQILLAVLVHGTRHHAGMMFLVWMLALWIHWPVLMRTPRPMVEISVAIIIAVQCWSTLTAYAIEAALPYSPGREGAAKIAALRQADPTLNIVGVGYGVTAVVPFFPGNVFANHSRNSAAAYYLWSDAEGIPFHPGPVQLLETVAHNPDADLFVLNVTSGTRGEGLDYAIISAGLEQVDEARGYHVWRGAAYRNDLVFLRRRAPPRLAS